MDDYKIALGALLDANAKGDINKQLNAIKDLSVTISKATLSNDVINDIKRQLTQNGIDLKLVFGNVNQITNQAKQTGQQIGKLISDSAEQAISNVSSKNIGRYFRIDSSTSNQFRNEMEKLVSEWTNAKGKLTDLNIQTRTSYDKKADANITRLHQATVTYKNELDEVIKKTIAWRQIGTTTNAKGEEEILRGFVEVAGQYSKSLDTATVKTDKFVDRQKQAVSNLKNTLSTIESKFNDNGASKHLTNTTHITDVQKKIGEVNNAITTLQNSNKSTFTQAKTDVERLITELNNLITKYQNAEYAATSLRTKDINTIKTDETNKLDAFIEKMKQSGHYTSDLKDKADTLKTDLKTVFDTDSLTKYLNSLSNLQSEFKKVDEAAKTSEKNTKIQTNVESEKRVLQVYVNQLKEAGVYTGDVKTKIEKMFSSLSNVNSQNGLTTWRAELKGVKAETDAIKKQLEDEYKQRQKNIQAAQKQAELDKQNALAFTKSASKRLSSAISKYSYGDTSDANAMMKQMNRGLSNFGDLSNVQGNITQLSSAIDKIIADLKTSHEQSLKALNSAISAEEKAKKQIQPSIDNGAFSTQIDKMVSQFQKYGLSVDEAEEKVKELRTTLLSMETAPSNESLVTDYQRWEQQIKDVNVQLEQAKLNYDKIAQEKLKEIDLSITNKSYEAEIAKLTDDFRNLSGDINEAKTHTESLNKVYRAMIDATDDNTRLEAEKQYQLELSKTKNLLTIAQAEAREYVDALKVSKLRNDIQDWLKKNTAATKEAKDAMKTYLEMLDDVDGISQATFNTVKGGMDDWDTKMRQAGKLGKSSTETFKEGAKSFIEWTVSSVSVMEVVQAVKKMGQAVYEIDTAMTNLYKVTDETNKRYDKFLDSATGKAQELGRTVSSLVEQTANWSKLGFSLDEAEKLAEISSIYANVGEVDDATAVSDMVTAMKAFNIEASDAITIVDMLNTLGNKYATSAADLGTGLSKSASAMATAGTSIEKTLAMLTGGAEITQSADEFGNMLKIGSMRIRGMKGELEALGEEVDENVESISKMQTQVLNLTHGKVNIFNDNGEFKDYYDIMEGVAKIYSDLSSTEQASLSEILFGKQRGNQGAALIQAFQSGQIQKAYADIQDSAGSAYEEQARWMESLEAKTAQFEAAFQSLSQTILDSNLLKWFVDFGTGSVNALEWVIDKIGTLGTISVIGGGILGAKNSGREKCYPSYHICL